MNEDVTKKVEKCTNYTILGTIVMQALMAMGRFKGVDHTKIATGVYSRIKARAAQVNK